MRLKDADHILGNVICLGGGASGFSEFPPSGIEQRRFAAFVQNCLQQECLRVSRMATYLLTTIRKKGKMRVAVTTIHHTWDEAEAAFDLAIFYPDVQIVRVVRHGRTVMAFDNL